MMTSVLVTVTGPDSPGVTGVLFAVLTAHDVDRSGVDVVDVEQVVIRGALTLGVLVDTAGDTEALQQRVEQAMAAIGMQVRVSIGDVVSDNRRPVTHLVLVMGRPLQASTIGVLARRFGELGVNIDAIKRVADYPVTGLELAVSVPDESALRTVVAQVGRSAGVDIAVQRAGLERRSKRLIVFDVDSTLITGEVIEMLADHTGSRSMVEEITAAAMRGELDFAEALRARVAMLAGLDAAVLDQVGESLELTPGARTTIRTLKRLGYRCGIVSGGFTQVAKHLVDALGLDFLAANTLEVSGGRLTGKVVGDIVDRPGKARALQRFAADFDIPLSQTVAVGDGANDIDMLSTAGLGIAFNAKPVVAQHADTALNQPFLDPVLFILGISRADVEAADAADGVTAVPRRTQS